MKAILLFTMTIFVSSQLAYAKKKVTPEVKFNPETKLIMNQVYNNISKVFPLSFNPEEFKKESNRKKVTTVLKNLSGIGKRLNKLSKKGEKGFEYMSRTFASDIQQIYKWYKEGDYEGARFYIHQVVDDCVQCHSKLPAEHNFQASSTLFKKVEIKTLPPLERARLQIATRQFDSALKTYEKYFLSSIGTTESAYSKGAYLDYLKICIRVKEDLNRPVKLFEKILKKKNLPKYLTRLISSWKTDLVNLNNRHFLKDISNKSAINLIDEGKRQMAFGSDRISLINYTAASAILHKVVRDLKQKKNVRSEAYYLLGVTEALLEHSFWVSESKHFYETAIRLAPKSSFAPKVYALLEEQVILEYTGSKGIHVPDELKSWLKELEDLVK